MKTSLSLRAVTGAAPGELEQPESFILWVKTRVRIFPP